jgi:hypothetical protein
MIRNLFLALALTLNMAAISAQTPDSSDFPSKVARQFQFLNRFPTEKVYLHLDKPYYSAGESIFYSAYLTDGNTLQLSPYSQFVYVELINKSDTVCYRYKIRKDSLGFYGNMPLPADLPAGDYHLRAYSWWMQNFGADYFFQRNVHIGNAIDKSIQSSVSYEKDGEKQLTASIHFTSEDKTTFTNKKVDYQIFEGNKLLRSRTSTIDKGDNLQLNFDFDSNSKEQYRIQIAFNDQRYNYQKVYYLPKSNKTYDVQFFPEGGNLINNGIRNIAFKAVGQNGLSLDVEGTVFNQKGDSVTSFMSAHKGMGLFSLSLADSVPMSYYAKMRIKGDSVYKTVNLPPVLNEGFGLAMTQHRGKLYYNIFSVSQNNSPKQLYLLAHQRGILLFVLPIADTLRWSGSISTDPFLSGIVHFMLLDGQGNALSERLVFVNHPTESQVSVKADKESYRPRQAVNLLLSLKDVKDSLVAGQFSVAVTEDQTVKLDSLDKTISSELLLTSDLKGYIEEPGYYLSNMGTTTDYALDLLMLTHGWTRFSVPDLIQGKLPPPNKYYMEKGQAFSGKITNLINKGVKDAQIIAFEPKQNLLKTFTADEKGNFVVEGFSFPDSTQFVVQALTKHGHKTVDLQMDNEQFPTVSSLYPFLPTTNLKNLDDYMDVIEKKFNYEGGQRVYHIKEVTVTASAKTKEDKSYIYSGMGNPVEVDEIEKTHMWHNALDIVRSFSGVYVSNDNISIRGHSPLLVIDDVPVPSGESYVDLLKSMDAETVGYVNVLKGPEAAVYGTRGANGIIIIRIRTGSDFRPNNKSTPGLAIIKPLGYYQPTAFYSPKYQTPEQINSQTPDFRTTVYWNPSILLSQGKPATLSFYTADNPGLYTITLEGLTSSGEPLHVTSKLIVKNITRY